MNHNSCPVSRRNRVFRGETTARLFKTPALSCWEMDMLQSGATQSDLADINGLAFPPFLAPTESGPAGDPAAINFDGFCLMPRQRLLFYAGTPLRIGDR